MSSVRQILVGGVTVGGGAPVVVQSMTNTPTGDAAATLEQVRELAAAGCELVRVTLPAAADVAPFAEIVHHAPVPIIADIHHQYRMALALALVKAGHLNEAAIYLNELLKSEPNSGPANLRSRSRCLRFPPPSTQRNR